MSAAARFFRVLGDPTRLKILELLGERASARLASWSLRWGSLSRGSAPTLPACATVVCQHRAAGQRGRLPARPERPRRNCGSGVRSHDADRREARHLHAHRARLGV